MQDLCGMLAGTVSLVPDRAFFVTPEVEVSFAEFDERTDRLATVLLAHGARAGEPLGILLPSGLALALTYWAAQKVGCLAVPLNPMYRRHEIAGAVATSRISVLVTDVEHSAHVGEEEARALTQLRWDEPGAGSLASMLSGADRLMQHPRRGFDDPVCLFMTSGTTGKPKGVLQTQRNQITTLTTMLSCIGLRYAEEICLNTMPLFNNFGATGVMNMAIFAGATMVSTSRWEPVGALDLITRRGVTAIWGSPTIYVDLCERFDPDVHSMASIGRAITAGAPAPEALIERFHALTGVRLTQIYGATETTGAVTCEALVGSTRPGTVGRPVGATTVSIVGADGQALPAGEVGEIRVAGDLVGPGYVHDPEQTAAAFGKDGWLSGDLGYLDEEDFLFLVGRKKEMIISGGNNIYPAEVEALITQHASVATCAVIGIDDARRGEIPIAVIVLRTGAEAPSEAEIIGFCAERLSAYKVPRAVHFATDLPLGPTGKVIRAELRARYQPTGG